MSCNSFQAVLFDLDGTLVDSQDFHILSLEKMLLERLGVQIDRSKAKNAFGRPAEEVIGLFAPPERVPELAGAWLEYQEHVWDYLHLFPGIAEAIEALRQAGLQIGVVTSQIESLCQETRQHIHIDRLVEVWITADQVDALKPDPAPVLAALEPLDCTPKDAIMVGDSCYDWEAARRAGTCVGVAAWSDLVTPAMYNPYEPEYVFQSPAELLELLK